jgi:hypothetical protein
VTRESRDNPTENGGYVVMQTVSGYLHPDYAASLSEFGTPRFLPRSGGWVLVRQIPGFPDRDATGCYPLFACRDWSLLHADLEDLGRDLTSVAIVADPFGDYDVGYLRQCFPDVVLPFKEHFVVDLSRPILEHVSSHHRRNVRKALENVRVETCEVPAEYLDDWTELYGNLVRRHDIKGIRAFSKQAFSRQLNIPGRVVFRAVHRQSTVAMAIWFVQGEASYYHLGASSELGYQLKASFALFWQALEFFSATGLRWSDLGAGAGISSNNLDGLNRFKQGWATGTRLVYFCGRILDQERYAEILRTMGSSSSYFPAYRAGEFS